MRPALRLTLAAFAIGCAEPAPPVAAPSPLVGTWKLVEWRAMDSTGTWQYEFGAHPRGYFVYGPTGFLSIHLMHEDGPAVTNCGGDVPEYRGQGDFLVAPRCYVGYFGSYRVENDSTVVHLPLGGTILDIIGTEQPRRYEVHGDSLWIERSDSVYRLLLRVK